MLGRKKVDYRRKTTVWNAQRLSWELKEVHSEETEPQPGKSFLCLPKMNHDTCERKERNGAPGLQRLLILQLKSLAVLWAVGIGESRSQRCHGTVSGGEGRERETCSNLAELSKLMAMLQENQPAAPCPESGHWFITWGSNGKRILAGEGQSPWQHVQLTTEEKAGKRFVPFSLV